jgi:cobalamin biosynthesis protein CbiG
MIEGAMGYQAMHEMSERVAKDPSGAAAAIRAIVDAGGDCAAVAAKYEVTLRTVGRWVARLKTALGAEGLGFVLREGRKPGTRSPRSKKAEKTGRSKKKKRPTKKALQTMTG